MKWYQDLFKVKNNYEKSNDKTSLFKCNKKYFRKYT